MLPELDHQGLSFGLYGLSLWNHWFPGYQQYAGLGHPSRRHGTRIGLVSNFVIHSRGIFTAGGAMAHALGIQVPSQKVIGDL